MLWLCYLAPGVINSTTLAENTRYVWYSYQSPNEDYIPQQSPNETLLTDCAAGSCKGRSVRCLRAREHFLVGSRYERRLNPAPNPDPIPDPRPRPQNRTQNGPKTGEKCDCAAFVCIFFVIPNPRTTISPLTLLVNLKIRETSPKNPTG